jgi:hypothetical protein
MNTITVAAYNRPEYLRTVLRSLVVALAASVEFGRATRIVIGIDPGGGRNLEVQAVALQFYEVIRIATDARIPVEVIVWPEHLGVSEHPRRLLQYVFTELRSQFNIHLEDDTVLSPDALNLAAWYAHGSYAQSHEVVCMSLHSRSTGYDFTRTVRLRPDFGVWGWCCTYLAWWLWLSHYWNSKRTGMLGYDWSASHMMYRHGLWALEPALSRVRNIGREHGVHQTPGGYDAEMAGLVWAGEAEIRTVESFVLDPVKPVRPQWVWGD